MNSSVFKKIALPADMNIYEMYVKSQYFYSCEMFKNCQFTESPVDGIAQQHVNKYTHRDNELLRRTRKLANKMAINVLE